MLANFIPGYNTSTNLASAGGGIVLGSGIMAIISSIRNRRQKKELTTLQESYDTIKERLGAVTEKEQEKSIIKVGILKQFAWKDGEFHHKEYKFIVDYIIHNENIEADIKLNLIEDLSMNQTKMNQVFKPFINFFSNLNGFFDNEEEKMGFISIVENLMHIDGEVKKAEEKFLTQLRKV